MHAFGCIEYVILPDEKRDKFDAKDTKCLFLGYDESIKPYRFMCLKINKIIKSRDVMFMKDRTSI